MALGYYPGCSLMGLAREYDACIRRVCAALDIELVELADWSCCGATSAHVLDADLAQRLPGRNLALATQQGLTELLVPCAACFNRLKAAQRGLESDVSGPAVVHIGEFLARPELIAAMQLKMQRTLNGLVAAPYYGCLSQRPPRLTGSARPENPLTIEAVLDALGGRRVDWSYKTDCCGASLTLSRPDLQIGLSNGLLHEAAAAGAELVVTDCPMCLSNIEAAQTNAGRAALPVLYSVELIELAVGSAPSWKWHLVDPCPLLRSKGFI